jgi:sulfhydrogenase subunit alpha
MHEAEAPTSERTFRVEGITRVEGEGTLHLVVRGDEVVAARLEIFEPPRYFEKLVAGRTPDEVIDIVARICGICPIAYQMGAVHAFESIFGVSVDPEVRTLRRLLYCGEWIESHALHIYLLHAPDYLGYASAIDLARDHRDIVEQGLSIKKVGNEIMSLLGGRSVHPVSVRVGGFYKVPRRKELEALRPSLEVALERALATLDLVVGLDAPRFERTVSMVSLRHPDEYPLNEGRIVSSDGAIDIPVTDWRSTFVEEQHEGTNALHVRTKDGGVYLLGPSARIVNAADSLHPIAKAALDKTGLRESIGRNPFWSIAARSVELIHACAEAIDIIERYRAPDAPSVPWTPRAGASGWGTEAPRGICSHYYQTDDRGRVTKAQIIAPTGPNQGAVEQDLLAFAPQVLGLEHDAATRRLEQLVRCYDPCISCATHFLDLTIERT